MITVACHRNIDQPFLCEVSGTSLSQESALAGGGRSTRVLEPEPLSCRLEPGPLEPWLEVWLVSLKA